MSAERQFEDKPAVREATPLMFGLVGPSGGGKTYSALRLATGMQRVIGGEIFLIDTESDRALHYADKFKFRHVSFSAPFSPLDYLKAVQHCIDAGAKIIIIDSMSHEHEGPGGVLEWHEAEAERLQAEWRTTRDKVNMPAWSKPKQARRRLINSLLQMKANFIFCFRAKDKVKLGQGKVTQLGFMPIAGDEFVYEMTAKALLLPGAQGVPTWQSDNPGEAMMIKLPEMFRDFFSGRAGQPFDEDIGEKLAQWAAGGVSKPSTHEKSSTEAGAAGSPSRAKSDTVADLLVGYRDCEDQQSFDDLEARRELIWPQASKGQKLELKNASTEARARL